MLNNSVQNGKNVNEVILFRTMEKYLKQVAVNCTYIETHGKGYVYYSSRFLNGNLKMVEIGDLVLITYDRSRKELRICTLQAKYKKDSVTKFLRIKRLDVFQWELLKDRPNVIAASKKYKVPQNILNFNPKYKSISAYGIFYQDPVPNGDIDFLFTIPEYLKNVRPLTYITRKRKFRSFEINCIPCSCNQCIGNKNVNNLEEVIVSGSMDVFEKALLSCKIGAVVDDKNIENILLFLKYLNVNFKKENGGSESAIDFILSEYQSISDRIVIEDKIDVKMPAALILVTDSGQYGDMEEVVNHISRQALLD